MSATRAVVRGRIREMLGDVNPSEVVFNDPRINESIARNVRLISSRIFMPKSVLQSTTLVAGTYEYTVSGSTQQSVSQVFLNSDGSELVPVPWEEFNAYYRQDTANPQSSGTPREWTMREDLSNETRLRFGPTPDEADSVKYWMSPLPSLLTSDTGSVPFSNELITGLESACAAEMVGGANDEKLGKLGLHRSIRDVWMAQTTESIRAYNGRVRAHGQQNDRIVAGSQRRRGTRVARF